MPTFYTTAELADMLKLHVQVVQRKLQVGEIPAYRIGREWRVEEAQLREWLESRSNQRTRTPQQKVIETFFTARGKLRALPAQRSKRQTVLRRLAEEFEPGRVYPEREVNALLRLFHDDVASLRRELVMEHLLVRSNAGVYRRASAQGESA